MERLNPILCITLVLVVFFISCNNDFKTSLTRLTEKQRITLIEQLEEMICLDQHNRLIISSVNKSDPKYSLKKDSLWKLQDSIDKKNFNKLKSIIKKYGYPDEKLVGKTLPIWIIFQHAPMSGCDEISILLKEETIKSKIGVVEQNMIKWHCDGRKTPNMGFEISK